jgi:hypothetical protein
MAGLTEFTVMAIIDAQDKASRVLDKVISTVEELGSVMDKTAEDVKAAADSIDDSLLKTASGADALALANDRVTASEAKLTLATQEQAAAEDLLREARATGASDAELIAGEQLLANAERDTAKAAAELEAAQIRVNEITKLRTESTRELAVAEEESSTASSGIAGAALAVAAGYAIAGAATVKSAADFQTATTHLVTDAGESGDKIAWVSQQMIDMASQVGFTATELANGMYHIESAGIHGAKGVDVLRVAAEGAKVGGADLDTVTKTLAGTMAAYGKDSLADAIKFTNELIATTSQGDVRLQDLTTTLGNVVPIAAAAGITFDQVGGAIATMTTQNMTAAQASQNLAHFIQSLERPNGVQIQQMQALGLTQEDVSKSLAGPGGLVGTVEMLTDAISKHTKNGQVFINTLQNSETAAHAANIMLANMDPTLRNLSNELVSGAINTKDYEKATREMGPTATKQGSQFLSLNEKMGAFNKLLANGSGESENFNTAMSNLTGGQIGLRTALMLSAQGGDYFSESVNEIAKAGNEGGGAVKNWDTIQKTFNQKLSEAKAYLDSLAITIGQKIIPWIEKLGEKLAPVVEWLGKNKTVVEALAIGLGGVLLTAIGVITIALAALAIPIIAVGALVILLKKAWDELAKWFEDHKSTFVEAWDYVVKKFDELTKWLDEHVIKWAKEQFADFLTWWHAHASEISTVWKIVWGEILVVLEVAWGNIKAVLMFLSAFWVVIWGGIKDFLKLIWDEVSGIIKSALHFIEGIIGIGLDLITGHWSKAWSDLGQTVVNFLTDGQDIIVNFFKDADKLLVDAGKNIVKGLVNGFKSAMGSINDSLGSIASTIKSYFPWSPAKKGPLSGSGAIEIAGKNIGTLLASGMHDSVTTVARASSRLAGAAGINVGAGFGAGGLAAVGPGVGGGGGIVIDMRGSQLMSNQDMDIFVDRVGRRLATRILPAGGVRIRS